MEHRKFLCRQLYEIKGFPNKKILFICKNNNFKFADNGISNIHLCVYFFLSTVEASPD